MIKLAKPCSKKKNLDAATRFVSRRVSLVITVTCAEYIVQMLILSNSHAWI